MFAVPASVAAGPRLNVTVAATGSAWADSVAQTKDSVPVRVLVLMNGSNALSAALVSVTETSA
jgi:hypothetical protein